MTFAQCLPALFVMAGVTYLIRMLPITLIRGKLQSRFLRRLLYYIPYAVLSAMTFPAIFTSAGGLIPSCAGCAVGVLLALKGRSLITVALMASLTAYAAGLLLPLLPL